MAVYSLSCLCQPQYVGSVTAALVFCTPGTPSAVPTGYFYQISVCRVANITAAPVSLKVWRVKSGATAGNEQIICPTINIPVATNTFPWFDLTAVWGITLKEGDAIHALAGAASSLVIHADGIVISI